MCMRVGHASGSSRSEGSVRASARLKALKGTPNSSALGRSSVTSLDEEKIADDAAQDDEGVDVEREYQGHGVGSDEVEMGDEVDDDGVGLSVAGGDSGGR